jgi:cupin 2 domain-containing protein
MTEPTNLFAKLPPPGPDEEVRTLVSDDGVRVERIVSYGHASPPGFWYDQPDHEWVVLLSGAARVVFEGDAAPVEMRPGDFLDIPAGRRHRVEWTTPDGPTVWLAVHYESGTER